MKSLKKLAKAFGFIGLTILIVGCGEQTSSRAVAPVSVAPAPLNNPEYFQSENSCYSKVDGSLVDLANCQQDGVVKFYKSGSTCLSSESNQVVSNVYCPSLVTTDYYLYNDKCYNPSGQSVDMSFCEEPQQAEETYSLNQGICYTDSTNEPVRRSLCEDSYYLYGNVCYSEITRQPVESSKCGGSGSGGGTGTSSQCSGVMFYIDYYQYIPINCDVINCSGAKLYNNSGELIDCDA